MTSLTQVLALDKPVQTRDSKGKALEKYYYIDIEKALEGPAHFEDAIFGVDESRMVRENFGRDIKLDLSSTEKEYANLAFPCRHILNANNWGHGLFKARPHDYQKFIDFSELLLD